MGLISELPNWEHLSRNVKQRYPGLYPKDFIFRSNRLTGDHTRRLIITRRQLSPRPRNFFDPVVSLGPRRHPRLRNFGPMQAAASPARTELTNSAHILGPAYRDFPQELAEYRNQVGD